METRNSSISFYYKEGRIRLSYSALERLGKPKYIRFLLSILENKIIIMGSETKDSDCVKVNYSLKALSRGLLIYSKLFVEKIFISADWNLYEIYIVNIEFDENKGVYEANLRNATKAKKK